MKKKLVESKKTVIPQCFVKGSGKLLLIPTHLKTWLTLDGLHRINFSYLSTATFEIFFGRDTTFK